MLTATEIRKNFMARKGIKPKPLPPLPDPVDWIEQNFYIPETNAPIKLVPYQKAVLREGLRTEKGLFVYSFILWSDIKKSAKSTIAGAISLYLAWHHAWETVRVVANDLKQADSRTFFYIERALKLNPAWRDLCKINNYHIQLPNHTTINAIPVDPKGESGGGDLVTTFTEVWAMKSKAAQSLWSETTLSPLKYGKSIRIGESYAGYRGESPILETLYGSGVESGQPIDLSFEDKDDDGNPVWRDLKDLEVYRNGRMLTLWNTTPKCPWQSKEYYDQEESTLTPSEFLRLHRNQWASSSDSFVPIIWWDNCEVERLPDLSKKGVIIGLDAARANDSFAIVVTTSQNNKVYVLYSKIWKPPPNGQIQFSEVEDELLRLFTVYNVVEVAYDPVDMTSMSQRLRDNVFWREFKQGQPRLIADKLLYDLMRDGRIEHLADVELRQHIENADAKPNDEKVRIVKRSDNLKIDACVALAMSADRSLYYNM